MRALRDARGWSAPRLAEELQAVGLNWDKSVVSNLENGRRRFVSVDELVALGVVFQVTPVALLLDLTAPEVKVTAATPAVRPSELLLWLLGHRELFRPPLNVEIGEYRPPGLPWGDLQPQALTLTAVYDAWQAVQQADTAARRAERDGTEDERAATRDLLASRLWSLHRLASIAWFALPPEIADYLAEHPGGPNKDGEPPALPPEIASSFRGGGE